MSKVPMESWTFAHTNGQQLLPNRFVVYYFVLGYQNNKPFIQS